MVARHALLGLMLAGCISVSAQPLPPELIAPVNDFAGVIPVADRAAIEDMIRALQQASGDAVVVATVETFAPYGDIQEYAVKMFENRGRGIGQKGKDNGVLIVLALKERQVRIEVGYDLEQFITDGFAGETSREAMVPFFRNGEYGPGLRAGTSRIVQRVAQARGVTLPGVPQDRTEEPSLVSILPIVGIVLFLLLVSLSRASMRGSRGRRWGVGPWSGWNSGVGPFGGSGGGTFGGGFGGFGGGGGGFGGFGGGRSGGGGGGAGW